MGWLLVRWVSWCVIVWRLVVRLLWLVVWLVDRGWGVCLWWWWYFCCCGSWSIVGIGGWLWWWCWFRFFLLCWVLVSGWLVLVVGFCWCCWVGLGWWVFFWWCVVCWLCWGCWNCWCVGFGCWISGWVGWWRRGNWVGRWGLLVVRLWILLRMRMFLILMGWCMFVVVFFGVGSEVDRVFIEGLEVDIVIGVYDWECGIC